MSIPKVNSSYFVQNKSLAVFDADIFLCKPPERCVGGAWGGGDSNCIPPSKGFMCTECPAGKVLNNNDLKDDDAKGCKSCSAFAKIGFIIAPIAGIGVLLGILYTTRKSPLEDGPLHVEMQEIMGQLLMFAQILEA